MLDPSLPWLAVGYKNFKQEDFCQGQSLRDIRDSHRADLSDWRSVLRSSTPQARQRRRVKSAAAARLTSASCENVTRSAASLSRPKSAQPWSHRHRKLSPDDVGAGARSFAAGQQRPRSAALLQHRPGPAQNRSVTAVERQHHHEKTINLYLDERGSRCALCPVECRPKSSSSHRPASSTGLLAANVPSHFDRYQAWTRPRTAPATRRDFLQLPRRNNIRRGNVPHYTNFVKRVELGVRDGSHSPPPRRRNAFEDEAPPKPHSPSLESSIVEDDLLFSGDEDNIDDALEEDLSILAPTPSEPGPSEDQSEIEPPAAGSQEAWTQPKAPTPSPAMSGRNSPEPELSQSPQPGEAEPEEAPPPRDPTPPPRDPTPPPRDPTPPPRDPTPPPRDPTPPPRDPTPPPRDPTPPPRDPTPPPRELTPPPRQPTPPPEPKPKKEVRIQEDPLPPPSKPKTVPRMPEMKTKSCLTKRPEVAKENEAPPKPTASDQPPADSQEPEEEAAPTEDVAVATEEQEEAEMPEGTPAAGDEGRESPADNTSHVDDHILDIPDKKKLGPPPKYKVDIFGVDSQDLLDMEMKMRRKGQDNQTSETDAILADIPEHLLKRRQPWQQGRLALSRRACRFEIPMDVHLLERMSPTDYLKKYCVVNKRRKAMYRRSFSKTDRDNDMKLSMKELYTAVQEALVDTVSVDQIRSVLELIQAEDFTHFGPQLFCAICSLLERLHYREFVTEDTVDQESLVAKEKIEDADFLALDWKFDGCHVNPPLKRLLYML